MTLAKHIYRQRLLIEAYFDIEISERVINDFIEGICKELKVAKATDKPFINCSYGKGDIENQGIEAFQPLIESGISIYTWDKSKFLSLIIFTCKAFDNKKAIDFTNKFFNFKEFTTFEF
jgi:S-adenosylmethionine decarboxylase